ncbi:TPMT family class I SAM-dependent methyltransferase [bacterium]|nr:TPMT family class I SAM-dependent methyltransferase [bacterium]
MEPVADWEQRYQNEDTGWDIRSISTPLKEYFDQLSDKGIKILIPGCGNGHEAAYLHQQGFSNVFLLDLAPSPLSNFLKENPTFPKEHLIEDNFFNHSGEYDLIVEQTFFCAIHPEHRQAYAEKVHELLKPKGKLMGLLWSVELNEKHPPFGGSKEEYHNYFDPLFNFVHFGNSYNSIQPRSGRELFLLAEKK